ncbi:hypothetical protein QWY31_08715 [Cytophagales bacterium LB-30]|uniref:Outer membrane protein beta-barrel domain-containing protein n=1 Tax=Shiella aurantiaca TaxID=3058365 RepID=A0ABT8F5S4_9BACT|nr:hypothetical protein [Shiella aurantiaca]MDN4165581.1 hypothetical protein [Shiella aurantiaca]
MRSTCLLSLLLSFLHGFALAQSVEEPNPKPDYLAFQTGFMADRYNSLGVRIFFEYQKGIKNNWQYGITYEQSRHLGLLVTDQINELPSNLSQLSFNTYYDLHLIKDRLFWTVGLGIGATHVYWDDKNHLGLSINASMTLNIRMGKRLYLQSSPLLVLAPFSRIYYSPMNVESFDNFFSFTAFPIGIKVKL